MIFSFVYIGKSEMRFEYGYTFIVKEYDNVHYINGRVIKESCWYRNKGQKQIEYTLLL